MLGKGERRSDAEVENHFFEILRPIPESSQNRSQVSCVPWILTFCFLKEACVYCGKYLGKRVLYLCPLTKLVPLLPRPSHAAFQCVLVQLCGSAQPCTTRGWCFFWFLASTLVLFVQLWSFHTSCWLCLWPALEPSCFVASWSYCVCNLNYFPLPCISDIFVTNLCLVYGVTSFFLYF